MALLYNASVIAQTERLLGPFPARFDLDVGRSRWLTLRELDPSSPLLVPPPGAPSGTVSLEACYVLAGRKFGFYSYQTALEGITSWVVPLYVLVGNLNFAKSQRYGFWNVSSVVAHVLGNPVDALWGLLTKLDVERRIGRRCRKEFELLVPKEDVWIFRTILIALDDFGFSEGFERHLELLKEVVVETVNRASRATDENEQSDETKSAPGQPQPWQGCRRAAVDLATYRVNNTGRALLALLAFCAAVASKLILANSGDGFTPHLPHTIALRAIMYWLGPVVILSAKAGGYPSEWTSVGILRDLEHRLERPHAFGLQPLTPWNGGTYTWQPRKTHAHKISSRTSAWPWFLFSLSVASVTGAWAPSFTISFRTPTRGVGARGVAELSFLTWWLLNGFATGMIEYYNRRNQDLKKRWIVLSYINMAGTIGILTVLLGSFSGWWRNCHAWSAVASLGPRRAYMDFNMLQTIKESLHVEFPVIIGAAMIWQLIVSLVMLWSTQDSPFRFSSGREGQAADVFLADWHLEREPSVNERICRPFLRRWKAWKAIAGLRAGRARTRMVMHAAEGNKTDIELANNHSSRAETVDL
ncbi:MAG: hypothetical protein M1816_003023 [Peltula sp. TS41687]|nr:MAG: hypothetical protein M1816_003023 [Peltula sp. TS41687]